MKTVYCVFRYNYEICVLEGIYESKTKALKKKEMLDKKEINRYPRDDDKWYRDTITIDKHKLE